MTDKEKIEKIKKMIEEEYPKYVCGCLLVHQLSKIVGAKVEK